MSFPQPTKQQARVLWFSLTALAVAILVALTGLILWAFGWLVHRLSAVLIPMAFALILAYILDPVVDYFVRKRMSRLWAICLVFALGTLLSLALIGSVLPDLKDEVSNLINDMPKNVETIRAKAQRFFQESSLAQQLPTGWRKAFVGAPSTSGSKTNQTPGNTNAAASVNKIIDAITSTNQPDSHGTNAPANAASPDDVKAALNAPLSETVMPAVSRIVLTVAKWFTAQLSKVTTVVEFLIGFILVPVYLFYFLLEKDAITRSWADYLPIKESAAKKEIVFVLGSFNDCMIVFFRGQVLVALCVGVLLATGYMIMGLNYAVLLGVVAAILGIVPYLGTITSLVLALTVTAIQFGDWTHPLIVVGIAATVKLLEDFVIGPKIIGERSGLHPLTIILAVMIGMTLLGGFLGALVAIPFTAVLRTLMFRYIWNPGEKPVEAESAEET